LTPSTVHVMWFLPICLAQVAKPGPQMALVLSRRPDCGHLLGVMRERVNQPYRQCNPHVEQCWVAAGSGPPEVLTDSDMEISCRRPERLSCGAIPGRCESPDRPFGTTSSACFGPAEIAVEQLVD